MDDYFNEMNDDVDTQTTLDMFYPDIFKDTYQSHITDYV